MTTALQENHRKGLPEPHEYAKHLDAVLKPKPSLKERITSALSKLKPATKKRK